MSAVPTQARDAHGSRPEQPAHPLLGTGRGPQLRPYQLLADAAITHELEQLDRRSTLLVQATGTGKTVAFCQQALRTKRMGGKTLIVVHRDELIAQACRKLEDIGISPDVEQGKRRASLLAKVVVASVQSLRGARLARFPHDHFARVIIDESHHATAAGYRAIADHFTVAKLLGVTATPDRADGAGLGVDDGGIFESVAYRYEMRDAIRDGWLVPVVARRVIVDSLDLSGIATRAGDLAQDQLAKVMETERAIRGVVDPLLELAGARPTVVFGVDVAHATALAERINDLRPGAARAVSGETDDDERRQLLADFEAGEFQFLCNCALLTEGWDCLDSETEILTKAGWRGMGNVTVGDQMYALDRSTGLLDVVPIDRYVERAVGSDERMLEVRSQHADIRTTDGHEFHVKYRDGRLDGGLSASWLTLDGEELASRRSAYALPLAAPPAVSPSGVPLTDDELRFIAWFMTDGGFVGSNVSISQSKDFKAEIRDLLVRLGLSFTERVRKPGPGVYPNAKPCHEFRVPKGTHTGMLARSGWHRYEPYLDKNVSPLLHRMTVAQFEVFWSELLKGDGEKGTHWLWCDRQQQVDAYTMMAVARGKSASFSSRVTRTGKTVFRVGVRDRQWLVSEPRDPRSARAKLVAPNPGERVWCVTNRHSTLMARRRGKIVIIGNCPTVACVAIARPTKSRALFVQMAGRGTRLLGLSLAESRANGKHDLLLINLTGRAGKHRLVGPVDCLAGSDAGLDAFPDDVRDECDRLLGTQQLDLEAVLAAADATAARRRAELGAAARLAWHATEVDPFLGEPDDPADAGGAAGPGWDARLPTAPQLAALEKQGVTTSKLPPSFTMADASRLLGRLAARRARGLCSYAQARRISAGTSIDTRQLTFERAKELCTMLRHGNWRPQALFGTPEFAAAAGARPHDLRRLVALDTTAPATDRRDAITAERGRVPDAPPSATSWAEHEPLP